ncbi:hypothetical protein V9T40_002355 [Parthenolecanium corni]|uniref:Uncharacterized protein n=1 Tax=Parthenolecanium corni TaxID=536013 RepID=A0AAN9TUD7_9HEMI
MTIAKRSENEKKKGSVLCTKAFHQVNSQPISRLFAVVDYALQDLRCGGETEIYIVTDYCSGLRNFKYYDRNIEVSIVEEFDDNLTELYFYVILAVFADPSKRIIRKVVRSLVQSFKSEDIEEDKGRFINLSPWLNAIVSCLVAAGKRQSALSWMLSAASSRDSSHSSSNATSENTSASNSSSNAIPANLPQSSSNAESG